MSRFSYNSPQKNCLGHYQLGKYTVIIPVGLFVVNFIKRVFNCIRSTTVKSHNVGADSKSTD